MKLLSLQVINKELLLLLLVVAVVVVVVVVVAAAAVVAVVLPLMLHWSICSIITDFSVVIT
jgi:hypothetical protein